MLVSVSSARELNVFFMTFDTREWSILSAGIAEERVWVTSGEGNEMMRCERSPRAALEFLGPFSLIYH